jgi:hypothetical protein
MRSKSWLQSLKGETTRKTRRRWEDTIKMDLRKNRNWGCGLESPGLRQGRMAGYCEHDNEPSGSIKSGEFLD